MVKGTVNLDEISVKVIKNEQHLLEAEGAPSEKTIQLNFQGLIFNGKQCTVLRIRDITEI